MRSDAAASVYFGAKTLLAFGLPALGWIGLAMLAPDMTARVRQLLLVLLAAIGYYLPNIVVDRMVFFRQRALFENFPDAADLLLVCVESGLGLDAALGRVAEEMKIKCLPLAQELHLVNLEIHAGASREAALRHLALRTGVESVETFSTMLIQADRFGTSIGDSLRVFSEDLRVRRRLVAEEAAAKVPLKLLFPLTFFVFPSLLLVLLGPAMIRVYRVLIPLLQGH